jgi:hypothetical protein
VLPKLAQVGRADGDYLPLTEISHCYTSRVVRQNRELQSARNDHFAVGDCDFHGLSQRDELSPIGLRRDAGGFWSNLRYGQVLAAA